MGFNKRKIDMKNLINIYSRDGMDGVKKHLRGGDAFYTSTDLESEVVEIYGMMGTFITEDNFLHIDDGWRMIEEIIKQQIPN